MRAGEDGDIIFKAAATGRLRRARETTLQHELDGFDLLEARCKETGLDTSSAESRRLEIEIGTDAAVIAADNASRAFDRSVRQLAALKATTLRGLVAKASAFDEEQFAERDLRLCADQFELVLSIARDLAAMGMRAQA